MAAYTQIGYSVADIAALKAIPPADRPAFAGALVSVVSTNQWFEFDPAGASGGVAPNSGSGRWYAMSREVLNANRTYFVRTDGNDSNDGLSNTAGGAFLTIQKAIDVIAGQIDLAGFRVTIQIADGTYTGLNVLKNVIGFAAAGDLVIQGNASTPSNVLINTAGDGFSSDGIVAIWDIKDLRITTSSGDSIDAKSQSIIRFSNIVFGTTTGSHLSAASAAQIIAIGNYSVNGNATGAHINAIGNSFVQINSVTITFSNNPVLGWFVISNYGAIVWAFSNTFTDGNTVSGTRYSAAGTSVIFVNGGGANYLPGTVAGTTATGAQYF